MEELQKRVDLITRLNWILLLVSSVLAYAVTAPPVSLGVILGGLLVAANFHLLKRTLKKSLTPESVSVKGRGIVGSTLVKYYIRFGISGLVIYLLISKHIVHPMGLLAGLSVVVASVFIVTMLEIKKLILKEAV